MSSLAILSPVSPILSGYAIGAVQKLDKLVFPKLPGVSVSAEAYKGQVFVEDSQSFMGDERDLRTALSAPYPTSTMGNPSTVTYTCGERKLASNVIPEKLAERSQFPTPLVQREAAQIARRVALSVEAYVAGQIFNTSNFGNAALVDIGGGGVQWSTWSTAKPDNDIQRAIVLAREAAYGAEPNTIIMGQQVIDNYVLCLQAQGVAVVTSGAANANVITRAYAIERIKLIHGLDKVIVGGVRRQTSAPGASATAGYLWGDSFWVGNLDNDTQTAGSTVFVRPTAAMMIYEATEAAAAGLEMDGVTLPMVVEQTEVRPPNGNGQIVSVRCYFDCITTSSKLGYLVTDVLA